MSESDNPPRKRPSRRFDERSASRFVEELSWLLSAYSDLDFKTLQKMSFGRERAFAPDLFQKFAPKNPNVVYLVGILPGLFMDESLFASNEDIAEFSFTALGIPIPRWQKKAKFELVGHIVCHAVNLDDRRVAGLVRALTHIIDGEGDARQLLKSRKERGMTWNEVIQNLLLQDR
jgi:hypothetical protein